MKVVARILLATFRVCTTLRHPWLRALTIACLTATLLTLGLADARAQNACQGLADNAAYQEVAAKGIAAVKAGAYDQAMEHFSAAQKICPFDPAVTYYMARTKHLSGDCATAALLYDQTLAHLGAGLVTSELTVEGVQKRLEEAQACAATAALPTVGSLSVGCADPGVVLLFADGREEPCPFTGELAPGTWTLTAQLAEHESQNLSVLVVAGESASAEVPVLPVLPVLVVQPVEPDPVVDTPAEDLTPEPEEPVESSADGGHAVLGWVSVGVGVALVGGGVAMHFVAEGKRSDVTDAQTDSVGEFQVLRQLTQADAEKKISAANTFDIVGFSAVGLGGVALVTGVLLLVLDDEGTAEPRVSATWWGDGGAVVWTGRF